jgi:hypothetical protein
MPPWLMRRAVGESGRPRAGRSLSFKLLATWYAQVTYRIEIR